MSSRQVRIVAKHRSEPDLRKLAGALIELARLSLTEIEAEPESAPPDEDEKDAA